MIEILGTIILALITFLLALACVASVKVIFSWNNELPRYRHYKGTVYEVVTVARDCENPDNRFIVYKNSVHGDTWIRESRDFYALVDKPEFKGRRFTPLDPDGL